MWVTTTSGSDLLENECCLSFICDWKGRGALEEQRKTDRDRRASAGIPAPPAVPMHSRTVDSIQPSSRHDTWVLTETSTAVGQCGCVGLPNQNVGFKLVLWPPLSLTENNLPAKRGHCERGRPQKKDCGSAFKIFSFWNVIKAIFSWGSHYLISVLYCL